jgi:hypothetical protein
MQATWDNVVAWLLVAFACSYLAWRMIQAVRRRNAIQAGCASGCAHCPATEESPQPIDWYTMKIVPLEVPARLRRREPKLDAFDSPQRT